MTNYKKKKILDWIKLLGIGVLIVTMTLTGCTQSGRVSENISQEADNFNIVRRITVINARTDTVLLQLTGTFSLRNNSENELEVICELEDGKYQKHYVYLNEYTLYVVEDLSGSNVSKYSYELNFLPEMIPGVKITSKD